MERCGKINTSNSGSDSWTGIGVVVGFCTVVLIRQWPHRRNGEVTWRSELLQILQEVRGDCKTRNQLQLRYASRSLPRQTGVPLFIEEITKAILESGALKEVDGHYELARSLSTFTIPATLQDSLMARLDRLVTAKGIAQLAAVIGRQFAYD